MSQVNLKRLRENSGLDAKEVAGIAVPSASTSAFPNLSSASLRSKASNLNMSASTTSVAMTMAASTSIAQQQQQEREFQRAVQPSSPISALLGAARQPLVMVPVANGGGASVNGREREQPLIRKLQAAAKEARDGGAGARLHASHSQGQVHGQVGSKVKAGLQDIVEEDADELGMTHAIEAEADKQRRKELEAQKARIVAQMVPGPDAPAPGGQQGGGSSSSKGGDEDEENCPPMFGHGLGSKDKERKMGDKGLANRMLHLLVKAYTSTDVTSICRPEHGVYEDDRI